jgi:hypothetical protein
MPARGARFAHNAVIFVHGFEGSGAQFESQALRLTSNGYPARSIVVFEYDSAEFANALQAGAVPAQQEAPLFASMDKLVARMKALTHRPQVDLLAHSLGTRLMQDYLNSSKQRARNVAHYVNLDGFPESSLPGGVKTLALWGTKGPISTPGRRIKGATNVLVPDSSHVQTATSPFSFKWFYRFFTGRSPKTTKIVPQRGKIKLSGRDVNFPQNSGLSGATVQVWAINQTNGQRQGKPIASFKIGSSGSWGPVTVPSGRRYEFAEVRSGFPTHHFYYEPFLRSDHLIRLLESDPLREAGGPPEPNSMAMVIIRYKEIWGDQKGQNDVLKVDGVKASNAKTCPLSREVNALFVADFNHDGKSEPTQTWPAYAKVSPYFLSSSDVFAPAQNPARGKVTVSIRDRGRGPTRSLTFPNWPGTSDDVTVQLNDDNQS